MTKFHTIDHLALSKKTIKSVKDYFRMISSAMGKTDTDDRVYTAVLGNIVKDFTDHRIDRELLGTLLYSAGIGRWFNYRRPFFRIFPGLLEQMPKMGYEKFNNFQETDFQGPVLIELPENYEIPVKDGDSSKVESVLLDSFSNAGQTIFTIRGFGKGGETNLIGRCALGDYMDKEAREDKSGICNLVAGCLFLYKHTKTGQPLVLKADCSKYKDAVKESDKDKYVQRARRRGLIGWEFGENIPTQTELNEQIKANGGKNPHIRRSHIHMYWTGKGRTVCDFKVLSDIFVNYRRFNIPTDYYGDLNG